MDPPKIKVKVIVLKTLNFNLKRQVQLSAGGCDWWLRLLQAGGAGKCKRKQGKRWLNMLLLSIKFLANGLFAVTR